VRDGGGSDVCVGGASGVRVERFLLRGVILIEDIASNAQYDEQKSGDRGADNALALAAAGQALHAFPLALAGTSA